MKRVYCVAFFFLLAVSLSLGQCIIPVVATVNPTVICQGDQVQLSAQVIPTNCGISATCPGNNLSPSIGSGNTAQPGNITQPPTLFGNFNKSARNQMLYLASELTPALGGPCILRRISFNLAIFNSNAWLENFTVKIACTNATSLSTWENNLTTVFYLAAPGFQPASGWSNTIILQTPFAWDGVSNLIVDVCWNNPITFGNQNNKAECTNTAFNSYLYVVSNTDQCGTNAVPNIATLRPNIRFNYCYVDINDYDVLWTPNTGFNAVTIPDTSVTTASPIVTTSYVITVSDGTGCSGTDTVLVQVDNSRVSAGADIDTCPGNVIALTATYIPTIIPGPPVYTWTTLSGTSVGSGQTVNVNPTVTTTYVVAMSGGGCIKRDTITITIGGLNASSVRTDITCSNANDGKIQVLSDGNAPFTYVWSVNANTGNVDTAVNLQPGFYTVTVTDVNGCSGSAAATLPQPPVLSFTFNVTNATCFGGNNGSITINPSGGTGANTYQWSNGLPPNQIVNSLIAGNYTVTVRDANLCSVSNTISVSQPTQIVFGNATIQDVRCFNGNTGRITTSANGGTGAYTYSWSHNLGLNAATASNLTAGSYTVSITDINGCTATASYNVAQPAGGLTIGAPTITNPTCFAGNNGSATVNPTGGVTPYSYLWNPSGQITQTATGLSAQTYTVVVTDDSLCTASVSVNVGQPAQIAITGNVTDVKCNGGSDGAVDITITFGVAPLTYLWGNGTTTQDLTSIPIGNYPVTVTDNTGCTQTASFTVAEPTLLAFNAAVVTNVLCFGDNTGSITANPNNGGVPPYTYSWNPSGNTQTISSLIAGTYIVTLTDANLCTVSASYQITEPAAPLAFGSPVITNGTCNGQTSGSITVSVTGGTGSYNYSWSHAAINSATVSSLAAGNYSVTVTDANACSISSSYTITEPSAIIFGNPNVTNVSCYGYNDGSAEIFPSGGTGNFSYTWNGVSGSNPQNGLVAGNYTVVVTDGSGCTASTIIVITEPAQFNVSLTPHDATCSGAPNGYIDATPAGGTPSFSFVWSNGNTAQSIYGLVIGSYSVTVTDNNSCTVSAAANISEPSPLSFIAIPTQVKCPGDRNGTIAVNALGGTPPYNYSVTQDGSNFIYSTDGVVIGLASGYYIVILADNNGCTLVDTTFVPSPVPDTFDYTTDSTSCYGSQYSDGAIHVQGLTIQNMPYQFGADGGALSYSGDLYNLTAGNHVVNAVNYWGCPTNFTVFVPEPVEGQVTVYPTDTTIQLGESVQFYSGFTPYPASVISSYMWSPAAGLSCVDCWNPLLTTYSRTNEYILTVNYNGHCVSTASLKVTVMDTLKVYIPNSFSPNGDGNNDEWMVYGEGMKTVDLKVFNRWGEKVYETSNPFSGWDGSYKGTLQNPAVFVYTATITFLNDRKVERIGSIMLLR